MNRFAKYIFFIMLILGIQVGIFYLLTLYFTNLQRFDLMFIVGLIYVILAFIFSSSGGLLSHSSQNIMMRSMPAAMQGFHEKRGFTSVKVNPILVSSGIFFLSSIVLSLVYW